MPLRYALANSPVRSRALRFEIPNIWSAIQHVENGGSSQMVRIEDGSVIFLSIGFDTAKIFVARNLDSRASFTEPALFRMDTSAEASAESRRSYAQATLDRLTDAIGCPKSPSSGLNP